MMRRAVALLGLALSLAACSGDQSALNAHGVQALHLKALIIGIVTVCSVVWAAVMVALIWALSRSNSARVSPPAVQRRMTIVVATAVGATAVIVGGLTLASFNTTRALGGAGPDDLIIKVSGEQWWWRITYPDADGSRSFETANEIRIPVGRNVRLQLEAADVIHSFWVPSLAGKQDLIPGRSNELTIRAERAGTYRGQCAEFCGLQHSHMALLVVAEGEPDFQRWSDSQRMKGREPANDEAAAGRAAFMAKPCAACHTVRGTDARGVTGPDLTHVGGRRSIAAGLFETTRGSLAAWIADPQTLKPGNNMPLVPLSSEELRQISAYMASLQ